MLFSIETFIKLVIHEVVIAKLLETHLRHNMHNSNLFYINTFAAHIRTGDYSEIVFWAGIL